METQFENQYTITEKVYDEYFAYFYFKKPSSVAGIVLSLVVIAIALWVCILLGRPGILPILAFVIAAIFFIVQISGYFRARKLYYKMDLEDNGGKPVEIRVIATPQRLVSFRVPDGEENLLEYAAIKKKIETRNLYILLAPGARPFVLKKDSFTKGSFEECRAFIASARQNKKAAP